MPSPVPCGQASRCFGAFEQDAKHFAAFARAKLKMPMLVLTGEKASGEFLIAQGRLVAENVEGVIIKGSGHWLVDEAPEQVVLRLVNFFARWGHCAHHQRR